MKINGHDVVFGSKKRVCKTGPRWEDYAHYHEIRQEWSIPTLDLYGWVIVSGRSLKEIQEKVQREVDFDLEQREKRRLGLPTSTYSDCCR